MGQDPWLKEKGSPRGQLGTSTALPLLPICQDVSKHPPSANTQPRAQPDPDVLWPTHDADVSAVVDIFNLCTLEAVGDLRV